MVLAGLVAGCSLPPASRAVDETTRPQRIVSLDYCADQYVLELADREQIAALSPDATRDFSYLRDKATGIAQVPARAEDVIVLRPDLVVRSYGGGPGAKAFFERAGIAVAGLGFANDYGAIRANIMEMAEAMGQPARGTALVARFDARLSAITPRPSSPSGLYMTPSGVTTGEGSLIHTMMKTAGLANFQTEAGWNPLPLERLARERPDLIVAAFFGGHTSHQDQWSAARHPVARVQLEGREVVSLDGAVTACGGWFVMDAIEAMTGAESGAESGVPR
jgi:iron complex transport system substrate-binding protein